MNRLARVGRVRTELEP